MSRTQRIINKLTILRDKLINKIDKGVDKERQEEYKEGIDTIDGLLKDIRGNRCESGRNRGLRTW